MILAEKGNAAAYRFAGHMCPLTGNRIKASPANLFATVIEGACWKLSVRSDLSRSYFCQHVPKTPMKVGEPWETIGHAANYAGRWINIPDGDYLTGGSGVKLWPYHSVEPAIEKEARLRSQQLYFRGGITACLHNAIGTSRLGGQEAAPVPPLDFL